MLEDRPSAKNFGHRRLPPKEYGSEKGKSGDYNLNLSLPFFSKSL